MGLLLRRYRKATKAEKPDYSKLTVKDLKELAKTKGIENYSDLTKAELLKSLGG